MTGINFAHEQSPSKPAPPSPERATMTEAEVAKVAAMLTGKQAAAVRGIFRWESPWEQEEGEDQLYALGIWNTRPKRREGILTPLGKALRAHLSETQDGK